MSTDQPGSRSGTSNKFVTGAIAWIIKAATGYGASIVLSLVFLWAISREEYPPGAASFNSWYGFLMDVYLVVQGVLILNGTGGRNIGKDFLSLLDIILSIIPLAVIGFVINNHFNDAVKNPLSENDWQIIAKTGSTVLVDVIILGWLGHRVSRLMGEVHISNRN